MRSEYITDPQGRRVRVKHAVRVKGDASSVQDIPLDAGGSATFTVEGQSADRSVLVAAAMNDATLMPASFQLQVGLP